jgi:hypothetical protein
MHYNTELPQHLADWKCYIRQLHCLNSIVTDFLTKHSKFTLGYTSLRACIFNCVSICLDLLFLLQLHYSALCFFRFGRLLSLLFGFFNPCYLRRCCCRCCILFCYIYFLLLYQLLTLSMDLICYNLSSFKYAYPVYIVYVVQKLG